MIDGNSLQGISQEQLDDPNTDVLTTHHYTLTPGNLFCRRFRGIGDVLLARCWNWQDAQEYWPPETKCAAVDVDYDTWVGPAEWMPFQANRFHYDWHWWYNFGCGDLGQRRHPRIRLRAVGAGRDDAPLHYLRAPAANTSSTTTSSSPTRSRSPSSIRATAKSATADADLRNAAVVDDLSVQRR